MELRVINYFLTVAQEGNITRAAEILHITQPTLSRQLMELENELGTSLFIRGKRRITLTDDGILFLQRAKEISQMITKVKNEFNGQHSLTGGVVSIGCIESNASAFIMECIADFSKRYPNVRFDLYNEYSDDIKDKLDKGLIDIGLLLEPVEISKYDFVRLPYKDRYGVIMKKDDSLADKSGITVDDIKDKPLLLPRRTNIQNEIINWFDEDSKNLNIVATQDLLSNTAILVELGMGYAVAIEGTVVSRYNEKLIFVPIVPASETGSVIVWRKNYIRSNPVNLFLQYVYNAIQA